jgi:glycosyltransferase involved in cell wall biosynthesis
MKKISKSKLKLVLVGPTISGNLGAYGGGVGGYTRNMSVYLEGLPSETIAVYPCYLTIRQKGDLNLVSFPIRFFTDLYHFLVSLLTVKPNVIHVIGAYGDALPREFIFVAISRLWGSKILYEIKGGCFDQMYSERGWIYRWLVRYILNSVDIIGVEGKSYIAFCKKLAETPIIYLPNVCPDNEIPEEVPDRLTDNQIKVTFVGYCYEGKGVFELVEGCRIFVNNGFSVLLTLAGEKDPAFAEWLSSLHLPEELFIKTTGKVSRTELKTILEKTDLYCLPSRHIGEGHNNSVNEALMHGCIVITTRCGFLGDILSDKECIFLEACEPQSIAYSMEWAVKNREEARQRARSGRQLFLTNFVGSIIFSQLRKWYVWVCDR